MYRSKQIEKAQTSHFDVVIIGSGAGGGTPGSRTALRQAFLIV